LRLNQDQNIQRQLTLARDGKGKLAVVSGNKSGN
jgi:hypothetical protein